ncbi:hypothetical protein GCM10027052_12120 [Parafrigoribacterium mesophilum]|uniref:hypothetical protein n=1 Tax=Parafrigoribacterium mesophilum TaxID=433646 RepID=UPI0031FC8149
MFGIPKARGVAFVATLALLGGTVWIAAGTTGAYFSDTHSGTITGTVGSIQISPYGGGGDNGIDFSFDRLLPGEAQTATVKYKNTGNSPEDVWIVFPNATALSALNSMGTYGEVHLAANDKEIFASTNLNDRVETCGPFASDGCWPLTKQYRVASAVAPGASGSVSFSFALAAKTVTPPATFNTYPNSLLSFQNDPAKNKDDQYYINSADGSGAGLPYQIVATQVGIPAGVTKP